MIDKNGLVDLILNDLLNNSLKNTITMALDNKIMRRLESSNWNQNGHQFHVFNTQEELLYYLYRSDKGDWWREEYGRYDFEQCVFNFEVNQWVNEFDDKVCFSNAEFNNKVSFKGIKFKKHTEFGGCVFNEYADFSECVFEDEYWPSSFDSSVDFSHAKFEKHTTFWRKNFAGSALFCYSNFEKGVDFEGSVFNGELHLFESLINGDANFKHVECKKKVNGWDLTCLGNISFEWANFREKVNFSEMKVEIGTANFHGTNFEGNAYFYTGIFHSLDLIKSVIEKGVYFLDANIAKANRETWRIIKHEFLKQNNRIESLRYHALEMREYEIELFGKKKLSQFKFFRFFQEFFEIFRDKNKSDKTVLFLNRISNDNNRNPFVGIRFTIIATVISYLMFLLVLKLENNLEFTYDLSYIGGNIKQLLEMLNITNWNYHPFNCDYDWAYIILFVGRIVIGYGIYQTIQAFRKFGKP